MQDICTSATYLAIFNNMDTVVFFNGMGREVPCSLAESLSSGLPAS